MKRRNLLILVALAITFCVLPFRIGTYPLTILTLFLINTILVVSFRFIFHSGDDNLGHIAFMGVGAYASAIMARDLGWSFWITLPLAGLVTALVALVLSYPLVRTKGFAFFMASLAAGEAMRLTWAKSMYFGGHGGIVNIPPPSSWSIPGLPTIDFAAYIPYYFIVLGVTVICLVVMYQLEKSRIGDTLKAIRTQDLLAECTGINVRRYRTLGFVIGASFAGIAGVLLAHYQWSIDPHLFSFTTMLYVIVWACVGGFFTFTGPIIGLGTLTVVEELLRAFAEWRPFIYGFILIATLLFLPGGLESLPGRIRPLAQRLRNRLRGE